MRKKVNVTCGACSECFDLCASQFNYQTAHGQKVFYCTRSCAVTNQNIIAHSKNKYSPFYWYMKIIKLRSKKKDKPHDLDAQFLYDLWNSQQGICPLTGWKLNLPPNSRTWSKDKPFSPYSASLDRIDSSIGYVRGNVRFISVMANLAKNVFSDEDVLHFAKSIVDFNK